MLVCLSSGARPRYLEDIVRALALPVGGSIQFRYASSLVEEAVTRALDDGALRGQQVCLAYLFSTKEGRPTRLLPCRIGSVTTGHMFGSSLILYLQVGGFAADDSGDFKERLLRQGCPVPSWTEDANQIKLIGRYCFLATSDAPLAQESFKISEFERITAALARFPDFMSDVDEDSPPPRSFFHILGIGTPHRPLEKDDVLASKISSRGYALNSGRIHSIRIYHFFPDPGVYRRKDVSYLSVSTNHRLISFVDNPIMKLDSDYDVKDVKLTTARFSEWATKGYLTVSVNNEENERRAISEVSVPIHVRGNRAYATLSASIIGAGIATPAIISMYVSGKGDLWAVLFMVCSGLLAGFASVFGYKRSL